MKVAGVILVYPLIPYLGQLVIAMGDDVGRQIANSHTLFNIFLAVVLDNRPFRSGGAAVGAAAFTFFSSFSSTAERASGAFLRW